MKRASQKSQISRTIKALLAILVLWCVGWISARFLIVNKHLQQADAIAILSGSSAYIERTHKAAELYHQGRAATIVLTNDNLQSGWSTGLNRNPYFVERAMLELEDSGVPQDRIRVLPESVSNTYEESIAVRKYAVSNRLRSLLVVTSAYHSRRAWWIFHRVFSDSGIVLGIETSEPGNQSPNPAIWWLRPRGWRDVAGEYIKLAYYFWKY